MTRVVDGHSDPCTQGATTTTGGDWWDEFIFVLPVHEFIYHQLIYLYSSNVTSFNNSNNKLVTAIDRSATN